MNKIDNTKQVRHDILLLKSLRLPKPAQQRLNYKKTYYNPILPVITGTIQYFNKIQKNSNSE